MKSTTFPFCLLGSVILAGILLSTASVAEAEITLGKTETVKRAGLELSCESGSISVPENRSRASSRLISIPWQRIRATVGNPARPALFLLNGGPGSSNLHDSTVPAALWGTRDIVLIGYRGVDGTSALDSKEFGKVVWSLDADLGEAGMRRVAQAFADFVRKSRAAGIDPDGYTARAVTADADDLRQGLGYGAIDLYGISYGTRLCYLYARDFPEAVHKVVMLGGNAPGMFMVRPADIAALVARYESAWQADLSGPLARVTEAMPDHWLWWPIDRGALKLGAQLLLANTGLAPAVFDAYARADRGDAASLAGISLISPLFTAGMNMGDFYLKGMVDRSAGRDILAETADPTQFGRAFLRSTFGAIQLMSGDPVPARGADDDPANAVPVQAETLVVNGSYDGSTPLQAVRDFLMPLLPHGRLVVVEGYGHDEIIHLQADFLGRAMVHHLDGAAGDSPVPDSRVPPRQADMDFALVAYGATGAVLLVPLILIVVLVLVVRRVRRRRTPVKA